MFYNYTLKSLLGQPSFSDGLSKKGKPILHGFALVVLLMLFAVTGMQAQTTLINPATDGGFSGGSFAADGWTAANQGTGNVKWVVGTAVSSGAITGSSVYVSLDNGATNTYVGYPVARTIYFYKDVAVPAGETNIALSFNWKAVGSGWQVFAAPTSVTPVGSNVQTTVPATIAGATSLLAFNTAGTGVTQSAFAFVPASFAGTTVRLIFMWSNGTSGGSNPPAAIDNISLVSRAGGAEINSIATGNYTNPATWDVGYVPSSTDDVIINAGHTVTIDTKGIGVNNLFIAGTGATLQYGTNSDEFTVNNDLVISGSGAQMKVYETTNGKSLKVGHDIGIFSGGRLDISVGNTGSGIGVLNLFGSSLQTVSSDGTGFIGGTVTATGTTNTAGIINQLTVSNTSTATPNIDWQLNNVRIKSFLRLTSGRIALGSNKIILGNYSALFSSSFVCNLGSGFIGGTIGRWYGTSSTGVVIDPGLDYNPSTAALFPSLSANGANRWAFIYASNTSTAGELAMTYTDASTTTTGLSIADGSYTITNRYNGSWSVAKDATYASTSGTYTLGLYATGAYAANDGSSRILNAASAAPGTHTNGTTTPFMSRAGMTIANLTAAPFYVGYNSASVQAAATVTTTKSGSWNDPSVWSTGIVPVCSSIVTIASGHTVTANTTIGIAGLTIAAGGTLINSAATMTVGCTNNNAIFTNFGTHTVSGGTLVVNGAVYQKYGSTFNQTGGNIIVDSNAAGVVANSVGQGGSSFKIDTANLNLTGGKITIVDPLINNTVSTSATTVTSFTNATAVTFNKVTTAGPFASGSTSVIMPGLNSGPLVYGVGMSVSGTGIAAGTTITAVSASPLSNSPITLTLSQPLTASIASGTLTFSAMSNGCATINLPASNANLAVGQLVTGSGIPAGTTIVNLYADNLGSGTQAVVLSQAVTGLGTSPITSAETLTFSGASDGCATVILPSANPLIVVGQIIGGTGIQSGTTVTAVNGTNITMSLPATSAISAPASLNFYDGNLSSFAFAYNSPVNYVAGINHTLQIGDAVSTDKAAVTTNGYLCNFAQGGGVLSLGNLTVDALDGTNRFMNAINTLSIQNAMTVTSGSLFKKTNTTGGIYFGGNITNNGTLTVGGNTINFGNLTFVNGTATTTATALPQTITGTGSFYNNLIPASATASMSTFTLNNTSSAGLTIDVPNFRVSGTITMTAGIIHTSTAKPLYQGILDLTGAGSSISGNFGPTCYIDGPMVKSFPLTNTTSFLMPVGKTAYTPISMSITGGAILTAEAFNTNTGTASANISGLSTTRWKVTREGTSGSFTDFKVSLGDAPINASNIAVQASTDQGTYDNVLGTTATFTAGTATSANTIAMTTATLGTSFTGYFAYASGPNCTTVSPGNTVASATSICATQQVTLSLQNAAVGNGVTYQWQSSADGSSYANISGATAATYVATPTAATYYRCNVTCPFGPLTVASTPVQITFTSAITGTTPASRCDAGTLTLGATAAAGTINWYAAATGGTSLGTGTSFTTPSLSATTTYYAGTETSTSYTGGKSYSSTLTQGASASGLVFNAASSMRIVSVKVYPKQTAGAVDAGAPITIKLLDKNGNQVPGTSAVTFTPVTNTGTASTSFVNTVTLNYDVPAGTGYRLLATNGLSSTNTLGRLTTTTYPVTLNGLSITAGASSYEVNDTNYSNFFDWNVIDICSSPRTAVVAKIGDAITTQPSNVDLCSTAASVATVSVATNATNAVYSWQYRVITTLAPDPAWITITSANAGTVYSNYNSATMSITKSGTLPAKGTQYRVLITGGECGGTLTSTTSLLNLLGAAKAGTITVNANACIGSDLTFTVGGYVGTSFQWQSCPISTATAPGTFVDIPGATGTSYTATNMQLTSNRSYRVIVTNGPCGNTTSTSATKTITVNPLSVPGTITGGGTVCSGGLGSLKATGYVGKLQWEYSTDGVTYVNAPKAADAQTVPFGTTSASSTTSSYNITGIVSGVYFRLKVTSGACSSAYTSAVHYVIGGTATGGTVTPAESTICPGTGTTLSLSGAVGTITWQKSTNWLSATPLWTATPNHTTTYATGNLTATTAFRAMVTIGTCSTVYSSLGVVNVVGKPLAKPIAKNTTTPSGATLATAMCTTDASKVLTMGTGYIGFIQWQVSTTSTTTGFTDIVGANTASYTITSPVVGANYYRVKLGNACGTELYSAVVTQYYKDCSAKADDSELVNTVKAPFTVVAYPNPYNDNFNLSLTTSSEENVGVKVYDMLGKLIDQREVRPSEVAELHVGDTYPTGIYNVIITQGSDIKTLRVVKR